MNPNLAVVICTQNRVDDAAACLAALRAQAASHALDVILVDSDSHPDASRALVDLCERERVRYLRAPQSGLSRARNVGLAQARSEWVAFVDDDARVAPDWTDQLLALLARSAPRVGLYGGRIEALFPEGVDASGITERWKLMLSCVESRARGSAAEGFNICGANFVVRRAAIEAIGGFPLELGRVGGTLIGGEECYVIRRLLARNYDVLYDPAFAVQHRIHADRMRRAWIERRAFWEGVTQVAVCDALDERVPFHLSPVKLAVTLPYLWMLAHSGRSDGRIRYRMALGGIYASFMRLRPGAFRAGDAGALSRA